MLEMIGGIANPCSIHKGGFMGEEKCAVMDLAKLLLQTR